MTITNNFIIIWYDKNYRNNKKYFDTNGNKSAGIRARKVVQELKTTLQNLRKDILEKSKQ